MEQGQCACVVEVDLLGVDMTIEVDNANFVARWGRRRAVGKRE